MCCVACDFAIADYGIDKGPMMTAPSVTGFACSSLDISVALRCRPAHSTSVMSFAALCLVRKVLVIGRSSDPQVVSATPCLSHHPKTFNAAAAAAASAEVAAAAAAAEASSSRPV